MCGRIQGRVTIDKSPLHSLTR